MKNITAFLTYSLFLFIFSACEKDEILKSPTNQGEIIPIVQKRLDQCGTAPLSIEGYENMRNFIAEIQQERGNRRTTKKTYAVPLYCNIITISKGSDLTIQEVAKSVSRMNTLFKDVDIQFYIKRYKYIYDGIAYNARDSSTNDPFTTAIAHKNNLPGGVNVYFFPHTFGSWSSYTHMQRDWIVMSYNHTRNESTFAHELGHYFDLLHTHETWEDTKIELVDGSNSKTAGDLLTDTPADHNLEFDLYVDENCNYSDTATVRDPNGDMYNPDTRNIMSYSSAECADRFSEQQKELAYATLTEKRDYLISEIPYTGIGVFNPNNTTWQFKFHETTSTLFQTHKTIDTSTRYIRNWGKEGDLPIGGDFNGDGLTDIAVYRPSTQNWYFDFDMDGTTDFIIRNWGKAGDRPMVADFNHDGKTDIALYRPSTGYYYLNTNLDNKTDQTISPMRVTYDVVNYVDLKTGYGLVGDFFEDGVISRCIFDDKNGNWYFDEDMKNGSRIDKIIRGWGKGEDIPIVGDFNNDGKDDIARYSPTTKTWSFDYNLDGKTDYKVTTTWSPEESLPFSFIYPNSNHN